MKTTAIVLFVLMYLLIIIKPRYRTWYALLTAALYLLFRILPLSLLPGAVNWNVLLMMTGTMILVHFFIDSRMPNRLADLLLARAGNVMWVTIFLSLLAGIISAFIDNVATVLIVAPIGIAISRKLNRNPVAMILSIAVSSNLQGAATMIGDTTSIMLGDYARMTFGDFFLMNGRPGIFFAVELGALLTVPVMMLLFRKEKDPVTAGGMTPVRSLWPTILLLLMMALLIGASFFPQ
ncbi:MAG: SLC13 family permease, partial [Lachnospiraceae bacterium]|nr:SLC13 family permease [Lachnospiraceae bacterium]